MKKKATKHAPKLSAAERKRWDSVVDQMREAGIDPATRPELIMDYVRICSRVERLTEREQDPTLGNTSVSRAVNMAEVERRHLHKRLFAGAAEPEPIPTPAEITQRAAFTAWVNFFWTYGYGEGSEAEADMVRQHGDWTFRELVGSQEPTMEKALEFFDQMEEWSRQRAA